jgi:hypothetical protein
MKNPNFLEIYSSFLGKKEKIKKDLPQGKKILKRRVQSLYGKN